MTENTENTTDNFAHEMAEGFRTLADIIDHYPEIAIGLRYTCANDFGYYPQKITMADIRAELATVARAGKAHGGVITKEIDDRWYKTVVTIGPIRLKGLAYRSEVCDRVVVGTKTVVIETPDPVALAAVPIITTTEEVELVKWRCTPLLADSDDEDVPV